MAVRKRNYGVHSLMHPYFEDVFEVQPQFYITNSWLCLSWRKLVFKTKLQIQLHTFLLSRATDIHVLHCK